MEAQASSPTVARLHLRADACLTVQRPPQEAGVPCSACSAACPAGAIALSPRSVTVAADRCTGCGVCAPACPTGALEAEGFAPAPALECGRVAAADRVAGAGVVPCLGGLTAEVLRQGAATGIRLIDRGWCGGCPASGGRDAPWTEVLDAVRDELTLIGRAAEALSVEARPMPVQRAAPPPAPPPAERLSRRALFARIATPRPAPVSPSILLPEQVETPGPQARRAQLAKLAGSDALPGVLFPKVTVPAGCAEAPRLARLCPTGALRLVETAEAETLIFDAARCIACGDCTAIPGVTLGPGRGPHTGPVTLSHRPMARCPQCRMRFAPRPGQARCDGCATDTDLAALAHGLMRRAPAGG